MTACGGGDDTAEAGSTASSVASTPSETENPGGSNLTVNLFSWYDEHGTVPNGTEIDELTQQVCPDVRSEVLEIAGIESFAAL